MFPTNPFLRALALACVMALCFVAITFAFLPNLGPRWLHLAVGVAVIVMLAFQLWSALTSEAQRAVAKWFFALTLGSGILASLSACSSLGLAGPGGSPGNVQQVVANIKAFNDAASTGPCVGYGNVDWQPPLPPSGALHVQCFVGNPQVMTLKQLGAGGSFGGAGATATIPAAPAATPPPVAPQ